MKLDRPGIEGLVPQRGSMCLLEQVISWDENTIACRAVSHRDPANPLRRQGALAAITGVEYAAQAVAVHGGLLNEQTSKGGYLAALRDVSCSVSRLDSERDDLVVSATRLAAESGRLLYDFRVEAGGRELLKGRLSVVLRNDKSAGHGG